MKDRHIRISFWLLTVGGCLLWDPMIGISDYLPNLIGYLLLFLGVARLADLNDTLMEAQKGFRAMLWVGFGQLAAQLFVSRVLDRSEVTLNRYEQPVWILIFTFVFLVLEWYYMLPAWKQFFKGLSQLSAHNGGEALQESAAYGDPCRKLCSLTQFAVILRTLLCLLPEATVLTSFEYDAENPMFTFDWYQFAGALRTVAAIIAGVIGVIWLIRYLLFFGRAMRDRGWIDTLQNRYVSEILPNTGLILGRRVGASFAFFKIAILFTANLTIAYHSFLPDWLSMLLFLCGCLILGGLMERIRPLAVMGGLALVASLGKNLLNSRYLLEYIPKDAWFLPKAYEAYLPIRILGWVEAVFTLGTVALLLYALILMSKRHTAIHYGENTARLSQDATDRLHARLKHRTVPICCMAVLSALCKILEIELQYRIGWIWMLQFAVSAVMCGLFCGFLSELGEWIEDRYHAQKSA